VDAHESSSGVSLSGLLLAVNAQTHKLGAHSPQQKDKETP
jgi:hypothetical protein